MGLKRGAIFDNEAIAQQLVPKGCAAIARKLDPDSNAIIIYCCPLNMGDINQEKQFNDYDHGAKVRFGEKNLVYLKN